MRHIDPHDDMQEGIEEAPPPDRNPDGTIVVPPRRAELPPRPSLCQAGPCRHYHRFATQVDAANPRAVRLPIAPPYNHTREDSPLTPCPACAQLAGAPLYQAPAVFHVEVHHYCYPTPGVEMPLGALAITECSRWDPVQAEDHDGRALANRREAFQWTAEGVRWGKSLVDWEAARLAEAEAATEAERLLAGVLQDATERRACQFCGRQFVPHDLDAAGACAGCAPQAQAEEQQRARRREAQASPADVASETPTPSVSCHPGRRCANWPDCEHCGPPRI